MTGLGAAPSGWRIERIKRILARESRPPREIDGIVTAFRDGQVTLRSNRRIGGFTEAVAEVGYQGIRKGDLIVHSMDAFAGAIGVSDSDGKASPVVHAYSPRGSVDTNFVAHALRSMAWSGYIEALAKGIRQRSTSFDAVTLAEIEIAIPDIKEQRRIVHFLDHNLARLASLSEGLDRQVKLLVERRRAVIDSSLPSVEGMVPLKYLSSIVDTEHKTAPHAPGRGEYWIAGTSAVRGGSIVASALYETDESSYWEWTRRRVPHPGDVLFTREAPVGEVGLYRDGDPRIAIGQRMVLISPHVASLDSEFLQWSLLSSRVRRFIVDLTQGSLHPHLNMSDIGRIPISGIPIGEQRGVASSIASTVAEVDSLLRLRSSQLALLAERRRALITAAVTGQVDVSTPSGVSV